jgi:peptide/nickel transport system substrate-binding protein
MKRFTLILLAIIVMTSLGLSGCSQAQETDVVEEKHVLTIAQTNDALTFDPQNSFHGQTDTIISNMFSHLFERTATNEIVPDAAESIESVDDTTWRVTLKSGIKFHNGDPLTSEDVKYTFERVATDKTLQVHPYYRAIKEVRIIDELNFEFITDGPLPTMKAITSFSGSWILPKNYIETNGWESYVKHPIGSGPYKFIEWIKDDRVILEPFDDYFKGKVTEWDEVVFRAIPETSTRVGELLTGGVDLALNIPPNEWDRIDNNDKTSLIKSYTSRVPILLLRLTEGYATADPKVREAIELAIDRNTICDVLYKGAAIPTRTRMIPGIFGSQDVLYEKDLYNPERARELLSEAGYPDGLDVTMNAGKGRFILDGEVAELIAGMLGEVGIRVNLKLQDFGSFVEVYKAKTNEEILLIGLSDSFFDSSDSLLHYTIERAAGQTDYVNEETDRLFFEAGRNMNVEERREQYQRIQDIVAEERPHIALYQLKDVYGVSDNIDFEPFLNSRIKVSEIKRK